MVRMTGMPRAQGCAGAAMVRMTGMPRAQERPTASAKSGRDAIPDVWLHRSAV